MPQGTFSERIRAGGAGIGGFYTPTGVGTLVAEGKETRVIDGATYVLETAAHTPTSRSSRRTRATAVGNLVYRKTARNFNPMMATAARVTIAEVEHLVEPGADRSGPWCTRPGIFVQHVLAGARYRRASRSGPCRA